jgi:hypothetical protein
MIGWHTMSSGATHGHNLWMVARSRPHSLDPTGGVLPHNSLNEGHQPHIQDVSGGS